MTTSGDGSRRSTVLVTGASTGLGLALARRLIRDPRWHPILTARERSMRRFAEAGIVESEQLWLRPLDVRSEQNRAGVVDEIERTLGGLDVLVNNAGVAYRSVVEHVREQERLDQMEINFRAPMELIRCAL
ncbi:MAG TPA: SDR family NAD(P)-dependent oxidoreductase, partial [Polyangiaceae bacterium]|nr:SDR family NAD(P)-dependent oxidoreductase [Polyangiaceae bacterium]